MPRKAQNWDDYDSAVDSIIAATSDADFLDQLIPALKDAGASTRTASLMQSFSQYAEEREGDIERIGLTKHEEFLGSINQLQQASTEKLAEQKKALVNTRGIRQNITDVSDALKESLKILHAVNNAHELIRKRKTNLNTWLFRVRETSQFLGELAFYDTDQRRERQKKRVESNEYLANFKLNSAIELVFDENSEFDVLDNDDVKVDFAPLFEALHIHIALNQTDKFRAEYAATRRQQKDLLLPSSVNLQSDQDEYSLSSLLEGVTGFAIMEQATMRRAPELRSSVDVEELWDSMCQKAIKGVLALFIQTMEGWGYTVTLLNNFQLTLFHKYAELLKRRFSDDFQEIVSTDDYMPMAINSLEEYEKVLNVSWFTPETPVEELVFPCVLPFSQMYPLCCIDIRNFLNQFYFFSDDHFLHLGVIDETLRKSLDDLLTLKVCQSLVERLNSQYLGQIVQILINLEYFETACQELEQLLIRARSSTSAGGPISLRATEQFKDNKKTAEKRIFELVNSKIDDLIDTSDYDWVATTPPIEPSNYMVTLTRFLSSIMTSTLLGLPREIKELIYFDALSHAANKILALPLSPSVKKINPNGVLAMAKDVEHLTNFVAGLENAFMLEQNLDELQQTIALMQSDNHDEFFDISTRNKKYGRVDAMNGPILLEKLTQTVETSKIGPASLAQFGSRFGLR
ncbi:hypothetical protein P8C59_006562 [Phyllachora maydis]|uniref:Exocyst complex component SEC15 n=1 Tax=Phyllachora maydis TaxID=1825666 RepID=A0AAD9I6Z9_9PEZI|nr:hypothetical protein P8C59_006562 [Phyllachora maydis]